MATRRLRTRRPIIPHSAATRLCARDHFLQAFLIRFEQALVDFERRERALGGCHDHELQASAGVAGDKEARDCVSIRLVVLYGGIFRADFAAELLREWRLLVLC